jgi:hypothetical protein
MRIRTSAYRIPLIWLLALLAGGLAAVPWHGPMGAAVAFHPITSGDFGVAADQPHTPWVVVIASASDMHHHEYLIQSARSPVPPIDYTQSLLIIVFRGWSPTSGYEIRVDHVRATAVRMTILATATEPAPKDIVQLAVTSPYEIIVVARPPDLRGQVAFQLVLNGSRHVAFELVKTIE